MFDWRIDEDQNMHYCEGYPDLTAEVNGATYELWICRTQEIFPEHPAGHPIYTVVFHRITCPEDGQYRCDELLDDRQWGSAADAITLYCQIRDHPETFILQGVL